MNRYSSIPISQVDSIPLRFTFHNEGTLSLDTVKLNVEIIELGLKLIRPGIGMNSGQTQNILIMKHITPHVNLH